MDIQIHKWHADMQHWLAERPIGNRVTNTCTYSTSCWVPFLRACLISEVVSLHCFVCQWSELVTVAFKAIPRPNVMPSVALLCFVRLFLGGVGGVGSGLLHALLASTVRKYQVLPVARMASKWTPVDFLGEQFPGIIIICCEGAAHHFTACMCRYKHAIPWPVHTIRMRLRKSRLVSVCGMEWDLQYLALMSQALTPILVLKNGCLAQTLTQPLLCPCQSRSCSSSKSTGVSMCN